MPTRYHVAVRRDAPGDDAVLVLADGSMPGFTLGDAPAWPVVSPVVERLSADHGIAVVALRAAWVGDLHGPTGARDDRLYEAVQVEGHLPPGAAWVPLGVLERRATPIGRAIDAGALEPAAGDRQPWYRPGWLPDAAAWIDARLAERGLHRRGPITQVRSWGRSALLRLDTDRGGLWYKDVPAVFAHEVAVTGLLADVDPGCVPPLVAVDTTEGRLLMEHVAGPLLAELPVDDRAWPAAMARLAETQRVLAADLDTLRVAGVPAAATGSLADDLERLLADDVLLGTGRPGGLHPAAAVALRGAIPLLAAACAALEGDAIGASLEHGDLEAGQVILGEMGPVFLDWSDATIAHPFLAAAAFLGALEQAGLPDATPTAVRAVAGAYLDGWTGLGDRSAMERALALAMVVQPLHMARLYADRIVPGLEQPWEVAPDVPSLLSRLPGRLPGLAAILGR
jgi:hypothetical protein